MNQTLITGGSGTGNLSRKFEADALVNAYNEGSAVIRLLMGTVTFPTRSEGSSPYDWAGLKKLKSVG